MRARPCPPARPALCGLLPKDDLPSLAQAPRRFTRHSGRHHHRRCLPSLKSSSRDEQARRGRTRALAYDGLGITARRRARPRPRLVCSPLGQTLSLLACAIPLRMSVMKIAGTSRRSYPKSTLAWRPVAGQSLLRPLRPLYECPRARVVFFSDLLAPTDFPSPHPLVRITLERASDTIGDLLMLLRTPARTIRIA